MNAKGTLVVTGGANGIGSEIVNYLQSHYEKVFSYDVATSEGQDVRNRESLDHFFVESLISNKQNDLVICAGVFRPIHFLEQTKKAKKMMLLRWEKK